MKAFFISVACLILGPVMSWFSLGSVLDAGAAKGWPTAEGEVRFTDMKERMVRHGKYSRRLEFQPVIKYRFQVEGEDYDSSQISNGDSSFPDIQDALLLLATYPKGSTVSVHYDPEDPNSAMLEVEGKSENWWFFVLGIGVGIGGAWGVRAGWRELFHGDYDHS